jgi:hypothetical protein
LKTALSIQSRILCGPSGHLQSNPISVFSFENFSFFFVVFPALKPSCGIHARSLLRRWDKGVST